MNAKARPTLSSLEGLVQNSPKHHPATYVRFRPRLHQRRHTKHEQSSAKLMNGGTDYVAREYNLKSVGFCIKHLFIKIGLLLNLYFRDLIKPWVELKETWVRHCDLYFIFIFSVFTGRLQLGPLTVLPFSNHITSLADPKTVVSKKTTWDSGCFTGEWGLK